MNYFLCLIAVFFSSLNIFSQDIIEEVGNTLYSKKNYTEALPIYKKLFQQEPDNVDYNYRLATCYLNTFTNRADAISHLEYISGKRSKDPEIWYYLGLAYQYGNRFDEAIAAYEKAKSLGLSKLLANAERQIETCNNGKELIKYPLNVSFQNLGKSVNTKYPDYLPLIPCDESFMVFTSRRKENVGSLQEVDGYYSSDIYMSVPKNGEWINTKGILGQINTAYDEKAVDLTGNGKFMMVYLDRIDSLGNIYSSENTKTGFQRLKKLFGDINSGFESGGSFSQDDDFIVYASNRNGGMGGSDLYSTRKLPNGQWAVSQNLGPNVNTKYDEDFPHLSKDGKILFFASQGHSSMGGYDIFKSAWDEEKKCWTAPQNIGYPINNSYDNMNISFPIDSSQAYLSTVRDDGFGDLDIYKVKFKDKSERYCIITGAVTTHDPSVDQNLKITINASEANSKETLKYQPIKKSGKYVMALTPGNYTIKIIADGFQEISYTLTINDVPFQSEMTNDFILTRSTTPQ